MIPFTRTKTPKKYAEPIERGDRLIESPALRAARAWVQSDSLLLVLAGSVGTGKSTGAAWALYTRWLALAVRDPWGKLRPHDGRLWVAAPHLARLQPWADEVAELERAPVLVVDDLGEEEAGNGRAIATISTLLTTRFSEGLPTVITTNVDGATFRDRYGERLIDRLRECGLDENGKARWWVRCSGDSLRGVVTPKPVPAEEDVSEADAPEVRPDQVDQMAAPFLAAVREQGT